MLNEVEKSLNVKRMQEEILEYWEETGAFEKSIGRSDREKVFYDGPPFPTGSPHHGTVLVSFIKDCIARYFTMRGFSVPRIWGWDCHGLPIEVQAEKKLGIKEKTEIEDQWGIAAFNDACNSIVNRNNENWRTYIRTMARWVDYDHSYKTMDRDYMESVIWAFKECYDRDLIYKDYRVTPYCFRCETSLSVSDTREADSTRPRQDPSVVVRFKTGEQQEGLETYILAWTTTPWTLPSNLALAVKGNEDYAYVSSGDAVYILLEKALPRYEKLFGENPEILRKVKGSELAGMKYAPLFPYFDRGENREKRFKVIEADFVETGDGVGVVHLAPAFGEDDYWACRKEQIELVNPVDSKGRFTQEVSDFEGIGVLEANPQIIRHLREKGILLDHSSYEHNYPHCWRCDTPLIYKAMDAWYFSVEKIKDRLLEKNQEINWLPGSVKDGRFGTWLENARDWNISRNRYWSTPIPVWICDSCGERRVFGSISELQALAGGKAIDNLHREHLDFITFPCSCDGTFQRVPEVLDCWFETGCMPYAQAHYPFERKEWFETHFPADYIVEYTGQIRCWFYYLHVLAVALFNRPAFRNCIVHGVLLASDGKKISKSRNNYTDPMDLMQTYGTDAFRLYLFQTNAVMMGDLRFDDKGPLKVLQQILLPLWNAYSFFITYSRADNYSPSQVKEPSSKNRLDQWILARLFHLGKKITEVMDTYQIDQYIPQIADFVDDLTNWYIRRSRRRFWEKGFSEDKTSAFETLHFVLVKLSQLLAPGAPFMSEKIYRNLTGEDSVHLSSWPVLKGSYQNTQLVEEFKLVKEMITLGRALRKKAAIKIRQPLSSLSYVLPEGRDRQSIEENRLLIMEELNVKELIPLEDPSKIATVKYSPDFKKLGARLGKNMKEAARLIADHKFELRGDKILLPLTSGTVELEREDILCSYQAKEGLAVISDHGLVIACDLHITEELKQEGIARELIRHIQDLRKSAKYDGTDRIKLSITGKIPEGWISYILEETQAEWDCFDKARSDADKKLEIAGQDYEFWIRRK